jgi:hypothetical protein
MAPQLAGREVMAYLIKISNDEYGWLKKTLGPFPDIDSAETFQREHDLPSYREDGEEWHVIASETCDQSPEEYHAEWVAEGAEEEVDETDSEDEARHQLTETYHMASIRRDANGTWWIGSKSRPDLLNMDTLAAAATYLDGLTPSMLHSLSQPSGIDSELTQKEVH